MKNGRNSRIISAYCALATVAAGVVALDLTRNANRSVPDFSATDLAAVAPGFSPTVKMSMPVAAHESHVSGAATAPPQEQRTRDARLAMTPLHEANAAVTARQ